MSAITEAFAPLGTRAGRGPWFSADEILKLIRETAEEALRDDDEGYDSPAYQFNNGIDELAERLEQLIAGKGAGR